jgi:hypothetical protein
VQFLADMGLSLKVCHWLRSNGHDVVHLCEKGLQRLPNGEISHSVSVIVFRLYNTRAAYVIERLEAVLATSTEALDQGAIVIVEEGRHRVRRLPFK